MRNLIMYIKKEYFITEEVKTFFKNNKIKQVNKYRKCNLHRWNHHPPCSPASRATCHNSAPSYLSSSPTILARWTTPLTPPHPTTGCTPRTWWASTWFRRTWSRIRGTWVWAPRTRRSRTCKRCKRPPCKSSVFPTRGFTCSTLRTACRLRCSFLRWTADGLPVILGASISKSRAVEVFFFSSAFIRAKWKINKFILK